MVVGVTASDGRVPSALPPILKNYTKAAIRTQPRDIIAWSCAYFNALADGAIPPVKDQLEFPLPDTSTGVTPGLLRVLHKQLSNLDKVSFDELKDLCLAMGVKDWAIDGAWNAVDGDEEKLPWDLLLAAVIAQEEKTILNQLTFIMQAVTEDPISRKVPFEIVLKYFDILYKKGEDIVHQEIHEYLKDVASYQEGFLVPADLSRPSCPLLQ